MIGLLGDGYGLSLWDTHFFLFSFSIVFNTSGTGLRDGLQTLSKKILFLSKITENGNAR